MEYKILKVYEFLGNLIVEVETEYGIDKLGLNLEAKYIGFDGQPRWKQEVKDLLQLKYGKAKEDKSITKEELFKEEYGKVMSL